MNLSAHASRLSSSLFIRAVGTVPRGLLPFLIPVFALRFFFISLSRPFAYQLRVGWLRHGLLGGGVRAIFLFSLYFFFFS